MLQISNLSLPQELNFGKMDLHVICGWEDRIERGKWQKLLLNRVTMGRSRSERCHTFQEKVVERIITNLRELYWLLSSSLSL